MADSANLLRALNESGQRNFDNAAIDGIEKQLGWDQPLNDRLLLAAEELVATNDIHMQTDARTGRKRVILIRLRK